MTALTIGLIDPFHPRIIDTIRDVVPSDWRLSIAKAPTDAARAEAIAPAQIAFVMATPMPRALLQSAPLLRFIQKLGAGTDRIDSAYCHEAGIGLARLQAGNNIPVAEHTVLLMLAACRQLPRLDAATRRGEWDKEAIRGENRHLHGKTIGIVGFGAIGRQVAQLLSGFGVSLIYYDPMRATAKVADTFGAQYRDLNALLAEADVVTLHLPLLDQTRNLLNADRIAAMKPGSILVNAARGGLVDEDALAKALTSGHLFAAGLDAFSTEPPIGSPLLKLPNTIVTPHCAGGTIDNFASVAARAVENVHRYLAGEPISPDEIVVVPRVEITQ
jgi:phosphoglycerate dehydrogenase-like enzyme